jgi:hypothetical protein
MMETKWEISKEVLSSKIDEEVVLMSIEADSYFGLDPVASHIWELLSVKPSTLSDLVQTLMEEYDTDAETCQQDVQAFIDDMSARKLIVKSA